MIKLFRQLFVVVFALFVLMGCSEQVTIELAPEVTMFVSTDKEVPIPLVAGSAEYEALSSWLQTHDNWYSTSGNYPGGVYIVSGHHGIQVTERRVIIYMITDGKPLAKYVQEIDKKELGLLKTF